MSEEQAHPTVLVLGIAGGTGSGKTTVATKIVEKLPPGQAVMLQHDWYYRDNTQLTLDERKRVNFDEPAALENELLVEHIRSLRAWRPVECPQYDFSNHTRSRETRSISPHRILVVEGILLYAVPELCEMFDLRFFVDTDDDIRLMRRIKRDLVHRGRDIRSIQAQYYETVRPMHQLHVAPSKRRAHLIIPEGGENRQAVDVIVGRLLHALARN